MTDFDSIVRNAMINNEWALKKICAPLRDCLGIPVFGFCRIYDDGSYCHLASSNGPLVIDHSELFYGKQLYHSQPYFRHPSLFESGYSIIPVAGDDDWQKIAKNKYKTDHMLIILKKFDHHMEIFFFGGPNQSAGANIYLVNQLHLLNKYTHYFKQEASKLITNALAEGYNAHQAVGGIFYKTDPSIALYNKELKAQQFLKSISPLTFREQNCLDLFKLGYSAQATGARLNISQRTVEHHFESIKLKLNCRSKSELLNF